MNVVMDDFTLVYFGFFWEGGDVNLMRKNSITNDVLRLWKTGACIINFFTWKIGLYLLLNAFSSETVFETLEAVLITDKTARVKAKLINS